MNLFSKMID